MRVSNIKSKQNRGVHRLRSGIILLDISKMYKSSIIFCFIVLTTICISANALCRKHGERCSESRECTTGYCRTGICINYGESTIDPIVDPCASRVCKTGYKCIRFRVTCDKAICYPASDCIRGAC